MPESCLYQNITCYGSPLLSKRVGSVVQGSWDVQEAAQDLEQQLGDPAAVVLLGCPEPSKVSMVAAFSPKVCF